MIKRICLLLMLAATGCDKPSATRPATGPASAPAVRRVHLESVRRGPSSSRVDAVEVKDEKIGEEFPDFKVIEGQ